MDFTFGFTLPQGTPSALRVARRLGCASQLRDQLYTKAVIGRPQWSRLLTCTINHKPLPLYFNVENCGDSDHFHYSNILHLHVPLLG